MAEKIGKITESTLIPLSLLAVLAGGIFWLSTLYAEVRTNSAAVAEMKMTQADGYKSLQSIDQRLSRIEGKLGLRGE